ncbi:hypothetical protein LguiB_017360 [Lonicera macranthoides]
MKLRVSRLDNIGLDLCFDLPSDFGWKMVVPKLKFHFKGVDLELPSENYMVADPGMGVVCLAMVASCSMSIFENSPPATTTPLRSSDNYYQSVITSSKGPVTSGVLSDRMDRLCPKTLNIYTMELLQEHYMIASIALCFSFLVAKFVAVAMSVDTYVACSEIKVKDKKSERRVRFVDEVVVIHYDECRGEEFDDVDGFGVERKNDEDWEEIERSELENDFAKTMNCVDFRRYDDDEEDDWLMNLGSNLQMQFFGIEKVAIEGTCYEAQTMGLNEGKIEHDLLRVKKYHSNCRS